jgi:hypothetical protein
MLTRPTSRSDDNIKTDRKETGWLGLDWILVAKDREICQAVVNTIINLRVPQNAGYLSPM